MVNLVKRVKGEGKKARDPFYDGVGVVKSPPQNVEKAKKVAKQKKGDMDAVLDALMGFDD
jgi:hypothetical protein